MRQEEGGAVSRELDEILGVMEKREMERELQGRLRGTAERLEEDLVIEDLDAEEETETGQELETGRETGQEREPGEEIPRGRSGEHLGGFLRPRDGLLAAFLIPVVIMILIFVQRGIFPFGDYSFLRTDMYHQYAPFFSEFHHKLRTGGSLLYSWDVV